MLTIPDISSDDEVFIYGFGLAGKWLSANLPARIGGFIDTDLKKSGRTFQNHSVYSLENAALVMDEETTIVISVIDIQDVLPLLEQLPHKRWIALGLHLENTQALHNPMEESREFVEYSLKAVEDCHKGFFSKDTLFLRSSDIVITEKCS